MNKYLIFGSTCAISGSIIYIGCNELYKIYVKKTQEYTLPVQSFKQLLNSGLIIGLGIGILRSYTDKSILLNN